MSYNDSGKAIIGNPYKDQTEPTIGPGKEGLPKHGVPSGYKILPDNQITKQIIDISRSSLSMPYGTILPFTIDGVEYITRVEPHYHAPESRRPGGGKWMAYNWHKGSTVYVKVGQGDKQDKEKKSPVENIKEELPKPNYSQTARQTFMQRLNNLWSKVVG